MNLKKRLAGASLAGGLGLAVLGLGAGMAYADPPGGPCGGPPGSQCGGPGGPWGPPGDFHGPGGPGGPPPPQQGGPGGPWGPPGDFHGPGGGPGNWGRPDDQVWRGRPPPWGQGPPPWGFGPPPPPPWQGPPPPPWAPPPPPFDYYGQQVNPVFDPGFQQWGFWFFGIWIPL